MRQILTRALLVMCVGASLTLGACSKSSKDEPNPNNPNQPINPDTPVADPENTVTVNLLVGMTKSDHTELGNNLYVYVDAGHNLCASNYWDSAEIIDIGPVSGLGNITTIPQDGWKNKAAIAVGHGYVLRNTTDFVTYARLYVADTMISTLDAIMGYTVKYQCPMKVSGLIYPIALSNRSLTFSAYPNGSKEVQIKSGNELKVKSKPYWCEVEIDPTETRMTVTVEPNETGEPREGTIVIANSKYEAELEVYQYAY